MTSTKDSCLAEMRASFAEVMAALGRIPRDRLTEIGVTDEWSVRDTPAHEAGYDRLAEAVETRVEADFEDPNRFPSLKGKTLLRVLPNQCWGHRREHLILLEAFSA